MRRSSAWRYAHVVGDTPQTAPVIGRQTFAAPGQCLRGVSTRPPRYPAGVSWLGAGEDDVRVAVHQELHEPRPVEHGGEADAGAPRRGVFVRVGREIFHGSVALDVVHAVAVAIVAGDHDVARQEEGPVHL